MRRIAVLMVSLLAAGVVVAAEPDLESMLRQLLEGDLRQRAGIGFLSFGCDVTPPLGPGDRFTCTAVDEEHDTLRFTLEVDDRGSATVVLAQQPATSLAAKGLAALDEPCRDFLDAYDEGDWQQLYGGLHPALREVLGSADGVRGILAETRTYFGEVRAVKPTWYAVDADGAPQLEYRLECADGVAEARFRLAVEDGHPARLLAFVVNAPAGSPAQAELLERAAREVLSQSIGAEITSVVAPLERLVHRGDAVVGTARLADGREIAIHAEQKGIRDDFDVAHDYGFYVLDVEFLLTQALRASLLTGLTAVSCESATVPDGGGTSCVAHLEGAPDRRFTVRRRGGEHRMFPTD